MKHILDIFPDLGEFFPFFNGGRGAICCRTHSRSPVINVYRNTTFIHTWQKTMPGTCRVGDFSLIIRIKVF